ncbi:GATA zinc finger domain-containing protein 7 isoform X1 [Drosophila kikkawai]|uniref:GATA zinc finger domain-containing protein 7 isoform X1 n=1 Tax=Drosophila kikkawai TaxID=30033 RepID=A0A6P4HLQ6_DROKI|nr:G-box-binding factor [Drosophila kikkawai]
MQKANMQQLADLDFDFQMPCRYFKSSFARSLSLNNNNNANGNGNSGNSLTLPKKTHTNEVKPQQQQNHQQQQLQNSQSLSLSHSLEGDSDLEESPCATPPPALPARRHTANLIHFDAATTGATPANQLLSPHPPQPPKSARNLNLVWPMQPPHQQPQTQQQHVQDASILAAPSHHHHHHNNIHSHIYDLPQQLQQQHQHQQQQQQQQHQLNVEAVILQNQVDTLHWQLKQTETNCEMYRAVMEEVARFFERYQQQQQLQQIHRNGEQIARSKSLHHVHGVGNNTSLQGDARDDDASSAGSASYLRARSSTNLMLNKSMHAMNEEHNYETIAPAGSYNAFKDFTWRRSPKKSGPNGGCKARLSSPEAAEEKLNQEAFRLARTIRNLLNTSEQQPDLTQPRHSLASSISSSLPSGNHRLCKGKTSSVMTLLTPPLHNSTSIMNATLEAPSPAAKSNAELIFLRANNMRDSRLSLRSSTDSSVHSTISSTASSSSKVETDEETQSNGNATTTASSNTAISNIKTTTSNKQSGSSTEDESGFSSISSFHDVGLPLSSTLMNGNAQRRLSMCSDSRNSTLKSGLNVLGLPQAQVQVQVQAQITASQSPSKTYRNANRYQRFSTLSNEDAAAVLWV